MILLLKHNEFKRNIVKNNKKLIWSDDLSIGNVDIDKIHEKLIDIYNDLVDFADMGGSHSEFAFILSKMTDYSLMHFKREEEYMQKMSYPDLAKHKNLHRDYIYTVAMYNVDLSGNNPPLLIEVLGFIEKWWVYHILQVDQKYEKFKKEAHSDVTY